MISNKKVLDAEIADYVLKALRDTVLIGTASDLSKNSVEIAGKQEQQINIFKAKGMSKEDINQALLQYFLILIRNT